MSSKFRSASVSFVRIAAVCLVSCMAFLGLEGGTDVHAQSGLKIGSVVHLKNNFPNEGGYLDTRGRIKDKSEFSMIIDGSLFVSTHTNPNRDNKSGSWKIVSATGKKDGETLVYGDKVHLMNMYPGAGYLDSNWWAKDIPIYKNYKGATIGVFTAPSQNRDNGSGTWIVRSANSKVAGSPVLEGDRIHLENGYPGGGYLDVNGRVTQNPAFKEYEGSSLLVFLSESPNRHSGSGTWTITSSK